MKLRIILLIVAIILGVVAFGVLMIYLKLGSLTKVATGGVI